MAFCGLKIPEVKMTLVSDDMDELQMMEHLVRARMELGNDLLKEGDYQSAEIAYTSVLQITPEHGEAQRGLNEARKGLSLVPLDLQSWSESSDPGQLQDVMKAHLGTLSTAATPERERRDELDSEAFELVFHDEGSIGAPAAAPRAPPPPLGRDEKPFPYRLIRSVTRAMQIKLSSLLLNQRRHRTPVSASRR